MNFDAANWLAYREANMRFADVVSSFCSAGDMVWVQDYHLMLLPMLLRSVIGGENAQGPMVRQELGRVKEGVDDSVLEDVLGSKPGVVKGLDESETLGNVDEEEEEVKVTEVKADKKSAFGSLKRPGMVRGMSAFQQQEMVAKQKGKEGIRIGFFLHTPFPSSEIYRYVHAPQ